MPHDLSSRLGRLWAWLDMHLVDHGFVRAVYNNFHDLGGGMYRLSQPSPAQIRAYHRRLGIRTIVNLRGDHGYGSYPMEVETCRELGIRLVDHRMFSRQPPSPETVEATRQLFDSIEYPALLHCKSGADRAGIASVLYRHFRMGVPIAEARRELNWRFGHFNFGKTAVLDYFFDRYLQDNAREPIPFIDWVRQRYDKRTLHQAFNRQRRENGVGDWIIDKLLHRE
ncbi:tyrosine-protein phosphatase [Ideonella sp.]|uniref:tyrosine-protein phosphatase n=1 Tax=Ideonella sp. TaxID=1929293 RepID=UPI0035AE7B35